MLSDNIELLRSLVSVLVVIVGKEESFTVYVMMSEIFLRKSQSTGVAWGLYCPKSTSMVTEFGNCVGDGLPISLLSDSKGTNLFYRHSYFTLLRTFNLIPFVLIVCLSLLCTTKSNH